MKAFEKTAALVIFVLTLFTCVACSLLPGDEIKEPYVCITVDIKGVKEISFGNETAMNADNSIISKGTDFYFDYPDITADFDAAVTLKMADGSKKKLSTHLIAPMGKSYFLVVSQAQNGEPELGIKID